MHKDKDCIIIEFNDHNIFSTPGYCDPAIEPGTGDPSDRDKTEDCYTSTPFTNTIQNRKCDFALTKDTFGVDKCVKSSTDGFEGLRFVCVTQDQSNGKISKLVAHSLNQGIK